MTDEERRAKRSAASRAAWDRRIANKGDPRYDPEARPDRVALRKAYEESGGRYYQPMYARHRNLSRSWTDPRLRDTGAEPKSFEQSDKS